MQRLWQERVRLIFQVNSSTASKTLIKNDDKCEALNVTVFDQLLTKREEKRGQGDTEKWSVANGSIHKLRYQNVISPLPTQSRCQKKTNLNVIERQL